MRERIYWPIWLWSLFLILDFAVAIAIGVALDDRQLLVLFFLLLALTIAFWWVTRLSIEVGDQTISVNRARIQSRYIAQIIELDRVQMRHERGQGLDPRAFMALRFWVPTGVKIILNDERDPTPYWLVSTWRAGEIKRALRIS